MFSKSSKLKQKLEKAINREKLACAAIAKKHLGGEWEEYRAAREDNSGLFVISQDSSLSIYQ